MPSRALSLLTGERGRLEPTAGPNGLGHTRLETHHRFAGESTETAPNFSTR